MRDTPQQHPQAAGGSWSSFLKSIASFNGDLSTLTAPPFILSGTSLTEFSSYWAEHPSILVAPAKESDSEKRALLVLVWFLTTLRQQYASRSEQYGNEKKPLNPFLGELFLGKWEDDVGTTELISEQVSHHPPATAYSITNLPTGVHLEGYNAQKASFSKTINIRQIGHATLTIPVPGNNKNNNNDNNNDLPGDTETDKNKKNDIDNGKETFLISLPSLHVEGLIFGSPFIELEGASYITSSSGYTAKIDYSGKGWLSGKKNSFTATLHPTGKDKDVLYSVAGQWTRSFEVHRGPAKHASAATLVSTYDATATATTPLAVAPVEAQHPLESRRAWQKVAAAIQRGDMDTVGREKAKIEQAQREQRARERAEGRAWHRRYFSARTDPDPVLAALGRHTAVPDHGDGDKTGGVWAFDPAKAAAARAAAPLADDERVRLAREYLGQS